MKQNVKEMLESREGEYDVVEYYTFNGIRKTIHTDNIDSIDEGEVKEFWEVLKDEVMDEEDYDNTVCANTGSKFSDFFDDGTRVLVVVVKPRVKVFVGAPAPGYAIHSISTIESALYACPSVFSDLEEIKNGPQHGCSNIYFDTEEDAKKAIAFAVDVINEEEECSASANSDYTRLTYDAGYAELQED